MKASVAVSSFVLSGSLGNCQWKPCMVSRPLRSISWMPTSSVSADRDERLGLGSELATDGVDTMQSILACSSGCPSSTSASASRTSGRCCATSSHGSRPSSWLRQATARPRRAFRLCHVLANNSRAAAIESELLCGKSSTAGARLADVTAMRNASQASDSGSSRRKSGTLRKATHFSKASASLFKAPSSSSAMAPNTSPSRE
mmetsp:Transcript_34421/g.93243  ORF Transcript_34421/g.93243 Transcript_34421/m.93243 type:complete len:202 (-) Transcript_34421:40-645(-)